MRHLHLPPEEEAVRRQDVFVEKEILCRKGGDDTSLIGSGRAAQAKVGKHHRFGGDEMNSIRTLKPQTLARGEGQLQHQGTECSGRCDELT